MDGNRNTLNMSLDDIIAQRRSANVRRDASKGKQRRNTPIRLKRLPGADSPRQAGKAVPGKVRQTGAAAPGKKQPFRRRFLFA